MLPALADSQYVLMLPRERLVRQLDRGDIVVLRHPGGTGDVYIKRIVGLPNETIFPGSALYANWTGGTSWYSVIPGGLAMCTSSVSLDCQMRLS